MGMRDWAAKVLHRQKRRPDRTPPPTNQGTPVIIPAPVSLPPAATNEVLTLNPVLSPQTTPSVPSPPTNRDAQIPVPNHVLAPSLSPTTITTTPEVPEPSLGLVSSSSSHAKPTSTNNLSVTIRNGLIVALRLLKEAVTGIDVPGLEAAVSGVVGVIDLIKDVEDNTNDLGDLNGLISNLANTISMAPNLHPGVKMDGLLRSRIDVFLSGLREMMKQVQKMLGEGVISRTANSQAHKDAIQDIKAGIHFLLNQFTARGTLSLELNMAGARQDIWMLAQAQEALLLAGKYEDLIEAMPRASARYNDTSTKPSRPCHPGTRTGLLEIITKWIDEDHDAKPYFWLCGEVGVGKTTVAHTIAQEQHTLKRLGASFFFSRHDDSRRNPHLLFTSIAYQLARFDHGFYNALAKVLKPDPDIVKRTPMEQFKQLVLQPLSQCGMDSSRNIVIVIDGLDECLNPSAILDVLAQGIDDVGVHLRVLISSRPYADILSKFKGRRLYHLTSETQFRDIDPESLSDDVAAYLSWSLGAVALEAGLPSPWPSEEQLDELIRRAAGLFIIASTYTKYIDDPEAGNPKGQLARIISRRRGMGSSPLAELDALYDQILGDLKSKLTSDLQVENSRDIIAFAILAPEGISVSALAGLFGVDPFDVRLVLRRLTAVILLPEDDLGNVSPFHASFGEYIQDATRCTVPELSIDAEAAYGRIAVRCARVIASAPKDGIFGVEYSCATGFFWPPKHFDHIARSLAFYLARSPLAQVEGVKTTLGGTGIWTLLQIASQCWSPYGVISDLVQPTSTLEIFPPMEGHDDDGRAISLAKLMISNIIPEINRALENSSTTPESTGTEGSKLSQRQALKFVNIDNGRGNAEGAMRIIQHVQCWMKYRHRNIMSFKSVNVEFDDQKGPQEVLAFVASPISVQHSSSLHGYLEKSNSLNTESRLRMALSIADGLRYLHGSSPPQPHSGINTYQIMVSIEGQPIFYPSKWDLDLQPRPCRTEEDGVDKVTCQWDFHFAPPGWYHWNPTGGRGWQVSVEARLQIDVWDFGSILYQMITGEEPFATYSRLAEGNSTLGYEPPTEKHPNDGTWLNDSWDVSRYEAAVPLLLDTLEASKDIKALLRLCWTVRPQDRPPMSEVFERLKAIVEDLKT